LLPVFSSSYAESDALNLSTCWQARHYYGRRRHASTHQPSSSSRLPRRRSFSPEPGRHRRRRRHYQRSCSPSHSRSPDSVISRAPSPRRFVSPPRKHAATTGFKKRLWNPSQKKRQRIKEEAARRAVQLDRPPHTIRPVLPAGRQVVPPKARPKPRPVPEPRPRRPTTPPRQTLLGAAPKGRAAGVSSPAVHSPNQETFLLLDERIDLYAFGAQGPVPNHLRK